MAINSTNRVIHRFIQEISAYEPGGEFYSQIIPLDTQAYAIYPNEEENRFFYVIGDGEHTYTEIRDGKGNGEAYKEYPVFTKDNLNIVVDGVEQEISERKAADELLQLQIDNEKLTREQIDEYLQQQIDDNDESISEIQRNLTKEVFERKQAVEEERVARINSDESLIVKLDNEIEERKHFDELLDEALGEEIQNREAAITNLFNELKTDINNHVNDKENPHQITKAQIGLGNVDNTSDLGKPVSIATQKAIDEISVLLSNEETRATSKENELESAITSEVLRATQAEELLSDTKLDKISDVNKVYGTDSQGNQIGYDIDSFGKVDDIKINNISIVSDKIANLGTMATKSAADYSTKIVADTLYADKSIEQALSTEVTNRENADINLQSQIDAITASSDVTDIVGSYADLENYDTTSLAPNSIIKVLQDENINNETTYYRWIVEENVGHWFLIGEEGPYYTKSEVDSKFVSQERTINGKALSSNITLSASDVGADSSGSAAIAEQNAKDYTDSLATNYATAAQGQLADTAVQPDDLATVAISGDYNDLVNKPVNISEFTNDANYVTESQLEAKQDILVSGTNLKTINNQSLLGSGNIEIESGSTTAEEIVNVNEAPGAISPLKVWQGSEQEYNQYELTTWKNWKTDTVINTSEGIVPFYNSSHQSYAKTYNNKQYFIGRNESSQWTLFSTEDGKTFTEIKVFNNGEDIDNNAQFTYDDINDIYYIYKSGSSFIYTSSNLVDWDSHSVTTPSTTGYRTGFECINGMLIMFSHNTSVWYQYYLAKSTDGGITWVETLDNTIRNAGYYMTKVNGFLVILGGSYSESYKGTCYYSSDGNTWRGSTFNGTTSPGSTNQCICYANGKYTLGGATIWESTDLATWTYVTSISGYAAGEMNKNRLAYNGKFYFMIFDNGRAYAYSSDGLNWTTVDTGTTNAIENLFYGSDGFVYYTYVQGWGGGLRSNICDFIEKKCYTLDSEPTTSSVIYSEPSVGSQLTVTSVGVDSITLSDGYVYNRNSGSDTNTYRSVGEVHPNYLCNINNVGVKIGNTFIADATDISGLQPLLTAGNGMSIVGNTISTTATTLHKVTNTIVQVSDFVSDTQYTGYNYRADVPVIGITANDYPNVIFAVEDCISNNYSMFVESGNGYVSIWCKTLPETAITIPTITYE